MTNPSIRRSVFSTLARLVLSLGLAIAGIAQSARAATDTWSGATNGTWDTTTLNWSGTNFTSTNDALFTGTPANNVTSASGLTIGTITLDNTFIGQVDLTGSNTVTGATTISSGTLRLTNVGGLGSSAVTVNSGGMLWLNAGGATATYSNVILGSGTTKVTASTSDAILTGSMASFTGTLDLNPSGGNTGKTRFTTTQTNLISGSATINVNAGTTLYLNQALNYGASINLFGAGNTENLGALRLETAANQTGSVTLRGNSFIGANGSAGTISGVIGESGGSFGFTKQGNSTLTLSGSNSYSGTTTNSAGTISITNNNALGTGTVAMSGGALTFTTSLTLANNFTLNNVPTFTAGSGTLVLNGNITGGVGLSLTPTNKITLAGTNSFATSAAFSNLNVNAGAGGVDITGSTTVGSGNSANAGGYLNVAGNTTITVQSGGSLSILGTTNAGIPGAIVGQNAAGTSTLLVNGGSLTLGGNLGWAFGNNIGTAIGVLTVSSGTATINRGSATATDQRSFVALGRDNATGTINLNGGVLATDRNFVRDGSGNSTPGTSTANFNFGGGTLKALASQTDWLNSSTKNTNQLALTSVTTTGTSTIDANGFAVDINSAISGSGGFNINSSTGTGKVTFGGASGYTGATTVTSGTLALGASGSISSSPLVDVKAGAEFDTTAKTTFTMLGAQTFKFTLNPAGAGSAGLLDAAGLDITLGVVDFATLGTLDDAAYVIASYTSLTGAAFATVNNLPSGYSINYGYNGGTQIALVPEPGTFAMLLGGMGMLTLFRRRRG